MFILPLRDNEISLNIKDISDNLGSLDLEIGNNSGNDLLFNSFSGSNSIKLFFVPNIFDSQFSFL